jgi:hypothetical protein
MSSAMARSGGGNFSSHNSGMSGSNARSSRGPSSGQIASGRGDSGRSSSRSQDFASNGSNRHGDGGRQSSFRNGDGSQFSNSGNHPHNANYDRVVAFMNGGGDHGDGRGGDRGDRGSPRDAGFDHGDSFGNNWGGDRGNNRGDNRGNDHGDWTGSRNGDHSGDHGNWGRNGNSQFANFDRHGKDFRGDHFDRDNFRHNADSIRHDFHDRHDVPFRNGWWGGNRHWNNWWGPWAWNGWWGQPWYWWGWSTAPYLDSWLGFGWGQPCYWDYGPSGYMTYNYGPDLNYQTYLPPVTEQAQLPTTTNYNQAFDLAHSAPAIDPAKAAPSDWLPLGVFSVAKPGRQDENWMIQLGVNKQGVLTGTYYNQDKDSAHPLVGMVDKDSHKAAWYFADGTENPMVFETSVDNLTEPQTTVMVHFAPGDSGVWQMVRLERPEAQQNQGQAAQQGNEALPTPPQHELP